ncbi:MAG: bifunctional riboflavin kinase/FAD synthetase [Gemmataceae bacterium]|nr:bifunctional riboflavin kinase/FAD synthetase [Gemmataceae bacterium]MDW8264718.1 bifunctional riboflavin kinase/FAD synthetase [Gemmataceae bacterium]
MTVAHWDGREPAPAAWRGGAVALGNFDGVHRGHAALLAELRRQATEVGGPAVAITFDPHPLQLLRPEQFQPMLTTVADRAALLRQAGADHVVVLRTTPELLRQSPEEFFRDVLHAGLQARAVVEGVNFRFGHDRRGTVETLVRLCQEAGLRCVIVPPVERHGELISSSRIRAALLRGEVGRAAEGLGRPYRLRGVVGPGQGRGRQLGYPTANLREWATLVPRDGVYAVVVTAAGGRWPAAAHNGPNPTFGDTARKVEVHLLDFSGDLLDQPLAVDFLERLRDTRTFASPAALAEQLRADVDQARRVCEAANRPQASEHGPTPCGVENAARPTTDTNIR